MRSEDEVHEGIDLLAERHGGRAVDSFDYGVLLGKLLAQQRRDLPPPSIWCATANVSERRAEKCSAAVDEVDLG